MDDIASLIARVEAAEGPDRELDAAVAVAAKQVPYDFEPAGNGLASWRAMYDNRWWDAPAYTASIDAAMTLVPEGVEVATGSGSERSFAQILYPHRKSGKWPQRRSVYTTAATPALALTAAALRAMEQAK